MRAIAQAVVVLLSFMACASAQTLVVRVGTNLNIRTGPGTNFPVMARADGGETLDQRGRSSEWILTTQGWVHSDFVTRREVVTSPQSPAVTIGVAGGQSGVVTQFALSPDSRVLATRARDVRLIQFWDFETGELLGDYTYPADFSEEEEDEGYIGIAFLSDERLALYYLNYEMIVVDVPSLTPIYRGEAFRGLFVGAERDFFVTEHNDEVFHYSTSDLQVLRSNHMTGRTLQDLEQDVFERRIDMLDYEVGKFRFSRTRWGILYHEFLDGTHRMYVKPSGDDDGMISILDIDKNLLGTIPAGSRQYRQVFLETRTAHDDQYVFDLKTGDILEDWSDILGEMDLGFNHSLLGLRTLRHNTHNVSSDGRYYMLIRESAFTRGNTHLELRDIVSRNILTFELPSTFDEISSSAFLKGGHLVIAGEAHTNLFRRATDAYGELWKFDIEQLFAAGVSDIRLTPEHAAVTAFRPGEVNYQPIRLVAGDGDRSLRLTSSDQQTIWFDPVSMAATSTMLNSPRGPVLFYRNADGIAHFVRAGGIFQQSGVAVSIVQGGTPPDYLFNEVNFETVTAPGPEVIPARTGRGRWNVLFEVTTQISETRSSSRMYALGGPEILQSADGRLFTLSVNTSVNGTSASIVKVSDVLVTSGDSWPAWAPMANIRAIARRSWAFEGAWNRSVDGRSFLAVDDEDRPGTYFIDEDRFIPFEEEAITYMRAESSRSTLSSLGSRMSDAFDFAYMQDGNLLAIPRHCAPPFHINTRSGEGRVIRIPDPDLLCRQLLSDEEARPEALDERRLVVNGAVVDIETGQRLFSLPAGRSYAASADGRHIYVTRQSGVVSILSSVSQAVIADLHFMTDGSWIIMTPQGFYASGNDGDTHLRVAQGLLSTFSVAKFRDSLYRPDLVAEALNGDPEGLLRAAAQSVSLERILLSGTAPLVSIEGAREGAGFAVRALIEDQGGGIGRLEWRVNGVTQQTTTGVTSFNANLFLAEGDNRIELVAYNGENTIQGRSSPLHVFVEGEELGKPRLHILALGINDYALETIALRHAENDATALAQAFAQAGNGLYSEIFTHLLLSEDVTREKLHETFSTLATAIRPNDVFVFFSAGHGITLEGRYFFIPQDISATHVGAIREQGIGHAQWQEWFSMIPAQKSLLLFDTCESGSLAESLVGRDLRFRSATDLLGNATGRALLSASSSTEIAWEGYEGHGIFTYSILKALETADLNADGVIDIDELAGVIQDTVTEIAALVWNERQTPQFKPPQVSFAIAEPLLAMN